VVTGAIREIKPPFSPEGAVEEFSALLKSYRVFTVTGDRYAGEWPREQFRKRGINYRLADKTKSDLFRDLLPLLNAKLISLPKSQRLSDQLTNLERRVTRGGRDSIDHSPGGHDDIANAVAGVANEIARSLRATGPVQHSWDGSPARLHKREQEAAEKNVAAGSTSCTINFAELEKKPVSEGLRRTLGPPRFW
jgi:hypothetical protein